MKTLITLFRKNIYFFLPFLLWLIVGGVMLATYSQRELFLGINGEHSEWADVLVTGLTYLGDGIMFGIVLFLMLVTQRFRLFFIGLAVLLLVTLIVQVAKHYFNAPRPISYFGDETATLVHTVRWVSVHSSCSFPSGHSAAAFGMFSFLALIWNNKKTGLLFFIMGICAAYSRIYLAQHFFADVYAGSIVGTLSTVIVYGFFKFRHTTSSPEVCAEALLQANTTT
ncbi:membrane-associated phospholipid phosphatase [Chitinophaga polysaccharea]|uniref:Phosphatase PAP2 family protein n=2 Tax=Chitinophaga TaxID=79328 RepID=A0A847SXZ3_9BACT|nr:MULTISPECIES: phosphatase PAP2 family protein [Chitinophaga]NLR82632.1 phosphatase PAP2 family protein [Chitinophaga eiseniae]TWF44130.1 membrane-associated phospholipid phosphatase [Chitinophaga polysaccharea]